MSSIARLATLGLSTVFGGLMVGLAAAGSHGPAVVVAASAGNETVARFLRER